MTLKNDLSTYACKESLDFAGNEQASFWLQFIDCIKNLTENKFCSTSKNGAGHPPTTVTHKTLLLLNK